MVFYEKKKTGETALRIRRQGEGGPQREKCLRIETAAEKILAHNRLLERGLIRGRADMNEGARNPEDAAQEGLCRLVNLMATPPHDYFFGRMNLEKMQERIGGPFTAARGSSLIGVNGPCC